MIQSGGGYAVLGGRSYSIDGPKGTNQYLLELGSDEWDQVEGLGSRFLGR